MLSFRPIHRLVPLVGSLAVLAFYIVLSMPDKSRASSITVAAPVLCSQLPALTGDTTTAAGFCATTTLKINGGLFPSSALFIGSNSSSQPTALTAGQATAALNPFTSLLQGLAPASGGGTTNFMRADGSWAAPPGSGSVACGGLPALTGDTTTTAGSCATATAKINGTLFPTSGLFVNSNASAQPGALTAAQATAALNPFTSSLQGLAPASAGGTTNFLRADGGWATPPGVNVPSVAPPYILIGSTYYTPSGFTATRPSSSPSWINSVAPGTVTAGTNGDLLIAGSGNFWASSTATATVEAEFYWVTSQNTGSSSTPFAGVWLYDSTNSIIWAWEVSVQTNAATTGSTTIGLNKYTYSGTGNPAFSAAPVTYVLPNGASPLHLKISKSGSTLSLLISLDGGGTYFTYGQTESVGTISNGGYVSVGAVSMTILSISTT